MMVSRDFNKLDELKTLLHRTYELVDYAHKKRDTAPLPPEIVQSSRNSLNHVEGDTTFRERRSSLLEDVKRLLDLYWGPLEYHRLETLLARRKPTVAPGQFPGWKNLARCRCWWDAKDELQEIAVYLDELLRTELQKQAPLPKKEAEKIKILFLSSNPSDYQGDFLRIEREMRDIQEEIKKSDFTEVFEFKPVSAVRVTDIQGYLMSYKPDIVHFSGHGRVSSGIVLAGADDNPHPVSVRALSDLFGILKGNIRCVVLNACYSESQAKAIAEYIPCVVGMSSDIGDPAAISFSTAFYRALTHGLDVEKAFRLGCSQIDLQNFDEQETPRLSDLHGKPSEVRFV